MRAITSTIEVEVDKERIIFRIPTGRPDGSHVRFDVPFDHEELSYGRDLWISLAHNIVQVEQARVNDIEFVLAAERGGVDRVH